MKKLILASLLAFAVVCSAQTNSISLAQTHVAGVNLQTGTSYTILSTDRSKLVSMSNASAVAVTLPQATGSFTTGFMFWIQNIGAGTATITPTTSTIDGQSSLALTQYQGVWVVSNGTNWYTDRGSSGGGSGTVTSVGLSAPSTFSVSGTPVTGSGTLALTYNVGAADEAVISTAANTASWSSITNCGDSSHAVSYSTSTHTFGCQSITAGGSNHNLLSSTHSDTTAASAVRGDGIFAIGATPTWQRLAHPSTTGGYFKWNGTDIVASTGAAGGTGACSTHQFETTDTTDAAPTCAQPAAADLSDGTTGSGAVVLAASPALSGSPTAPTQTSTDNSTKIATTAFVQNYAPGGAGAAVSWFSPGFTSGSVSVTTINVIRLAHFSLLATVSFNTIGVTNSTADASNKYSFGVFSLDGTVRYAHTTEQVMTGSNTFRALAVAEGTVTIAPGDYLFAWTGAATTATFNTMNTFPSRLIPTNSSTTTSLGVMPAAPINVPALSPVQAAANIISFILYK